MASTSVLAPVHVTRHSRQTLSPVNPRDASLRLTVRGRAVLLIALLLLAFVAVSSLRVATQAGTGFTGPATTTVTVRPGETLWQIARRVAPADDVRDTVHRLEALNGLSTASVQAGQRLVVPR